VVKFARGNLLIAKILTTMFQKLLNLQVDTMLIASNSNDSVVGQPKRNFNSF
jgi:hypothetical protein